MTKIELFRKLWDELQVRNAYFDTIPSDINAVVFDNKYVNSLDVSNALLMEKVFGDDIESVLWFLYEWKPGDEVGFENQTKKIYSIDGYIDWIVNVEGFKE